LLELGLWYLTPLSTIFQLYLVQRQFRQTYKWLMHQNTTMQRP